MNFAKFIIAHIFAIFKYFAKQTLYSDSPDYVQYVQHMITMIYNNDIQHDYSLSPGVWQSFLAIRSCNHLMRIISMYVDNTKKSEIS